MLRGIRQILPARGETLGQLLARNKGNGQGFDLLRIALAVSVFLVHTKPLSNPAPVKDPIMPAQHVVGIAHALAVPAHTIWDGWGRPIVVALLPMFFALSGFLVSGSAFRLRRVSTFLLFRVLRLWPALLTEITLSALILGPIFTTLPLSDYFAHHEFYRYFGNLVGWVQFVLPGVFRSQSTPQVNGNLWTLPAEFDCYAVTALLMALGLFYKRRIFTGMLLAVTIVVAPLNIFTNFAVTGQMVPESTLLYYFMMGMAVYQWREKISLNVEWFIVCAVLAVLLLEFHHAVYLAPFFLTYCTVWLGMLAIPKLPLIRNGDYSYGIYLYGFPIMQACVASMPFITGHRWYLFFIGGALTCLFAAISWHLIEKPSLRLKNALPKSWFAPGAKVPGLLQEPPLVPVKTVN